MGMGLLNPVFEELTRVWVYKEEGRRVKRGGARRIHSQAIWAKVWSGLSQG
jgi:hypothetical protein